MEKKLIILRGLPGAGKSTFAEILVDKSLICTADDYHMIDGVYNWKPENSNSAHKKCIQKCEQLMVESNETVVVANTTTTKYELSPYYDLAKKYGYRVFSIIVENRHNGISIHSVSEQTLGKMKNRFDISL